MLCAQDTMEIDQEAVGGEGDAALAAQGADGAQVLLPGSE